MRRHANTFKHRVARQHPLRVAQGRSFAALPSGHRSLGIQGKEASGPADA